MSATVCTREDELLASLERGFIGEELDSHVGSCDSCTELRIVAGALLDDRAVTMAEANVPAAGTMWWRLRVRHRHDAEATARRSLLVGQAATLLVAVALVVSFFGVEIAAGVRHVVQNIRLNTPLLFAVTAWLLIVPIAGWVAIRQK